MVVTDERECCVIVGESRLEPVGEACNRGSSSCHYLYRDMI